MLLTKAGVTPKQLEGHFCRWIEIYGVLYVAPRLYGINSIHARQHLRHRDPPEHMLFPLPPIGPHVWQKP